MRTVILLLIAFLLFEGPTVFSAGNDPANVEGRYGRETVEALRKLYTPPTDQYGLVKPKDLNSDWSNIPQAATYRKWIENAIGEEKYKLINRKVLEKAATEAINPQIEPVRKLLRNAFSGNSDLSREIKEGMEEGK